MAAAACFPVLSNPHAGNDGSLIATIITVVVIFAIVLYVSHKNGD